MKKQVPFFLGVVLMAGAAAAQPVEPPEPGDRGPRPGRGGDPAMLKQELGLNDQQVGELRKLQLEQRKAAIRRRADTELAQIGLQEQLQAPTPDDKVVQARIKELADLHAAGLRARVDAQLALRKILTPDQQEKLRQLRADRRRPGFDRPRPRGLERGPRGLRPGGRPGEPEPDRD